MPSFMLDGNSPSSLGQLSRPGQTGRLPNLLRGRGSSWSAKPVTGFESLIVNLGTQTRIDEPTCHVLTSLMTMSSDTARRRGVFYKSISASRTSGTSFVRKSRTEGSSRFCTTRLVRCYAAKNIHRPRNATPSFLLFKGELIVRSCTVTGTVRALVTFKSSVR